MVDGALLDPLTGLRNRRGFARAVDDLERKSNGLGGAIFLLLDIDHFKRINDDHGHLLGDRVLRAVARILCISFAQCVSSRLGDDQFALLLVDTPSVAALLVAEDIRSRIEYLTRVTVSIGVARARPGETLETVLERANTALYAAKRGGGNRVSVANASD